MTNDKEVKFSCPACGTELNVETSDRAEKEHEQMGEDHQNMTKNKVVKQPNAATMPMDQLKNKLSAIPGMPQNPKVPPNLNSY